MIKTSSNQSLLTVLEKQDKLAVYEHLSAFKERGIIRFDKILAVPSAERIPALIEQPEGRMRVAAVLTASLSSAFSNLNVRQGMNEDQVIELAMQIIEEAHEDNLGLEDVLLFLQQLVTGKVGVVNDRMDMPTFFKFFEVYRQERHENLMNIRYEQNANHKALGPTERASEDQENERGAHREALNDHLKHLYSEKE